MSQPAPMPPASGVPLDYAGRRACPGCGGGPLADPSFTWWGGAIGHKLLGVEKCQACKRWWVKKTGQPGNRRVAIYAGIAFGVGVVGAALFLIWKNF